MLMMYDGAEFLPSHPPLRYRYEKCVFSPLSPTPYGMHVGSLVGRTGIRPHVCFLSWFVKVCWFGAPLWLGQWWMRVRVGSSLLLRCSGFVYLLDMSA